LGEAATVPLGPKNAGEKTITVNARSTHGAKNLDRTNDSKRDRAGGTVDFGEDRPLE
jgi:hypothetical protein